MSQVRVVSFSGLRRRLKEALGPDSVLYARLDRALERNDEAGINELMDNLKHYPEATRKLVEAAMIDWLFNNDDHSGLADLPTAGASCH